tara:strand:- start:951 stop:1760 length:810 start_codon:yes stop_codon:yes gene_type:complete
MKHNKKRNIAFVYETLTRTLTKAIVDNDAERKALILKILQEHLGPNTVLGEELRLYRTLLETRNIQEKVASRLMTETKEAHKKLDESALFDAQSRLIAVINKQLGTEVWATFVPNFKSLASVKGIFSSKTALKKRVLFEQALVDRMAEKIDSPQETLQPIDNLTYHSFIKKFNQKYDNLLHEQKTLLTHYITSFADQGFEMKLYLNEELGRLKSVLTENLETQEEGLIKEKIEGVVEYLDSFRKREFEEKDLGKVLKVQDLSKELLGHD